MAFAERVRRARRRFFCEARFSAAALSRASSSAAARAFASALDAVPSEPVDVRIKLALALGALGAAGLELSEDLRPGAHHGVALLAGVLVVKTCVSIWEARE